MKINFQSIFSVLIVLLAACADKSIKSFSDEELDKKIESTSEKINRLISDLSCDSLSQCNSIKYGHKPCGGPMEYRIISYKNTNEGEIEHLSEYYFELTKEYNERNSVPTDCVLISPPSLLCDTICKTIE